MSKKPPRKTISIGLPTEQIERRIIQVRGNRVLLDVDLAALYSVKTGALIRQVRRNPKRFPRDFMFQLSDDEWAALRSQNGISKGRGGRRYAPYAFTEQGVAMLSSVLNSGRAIEVNVQIMRAFVNLRAILGSHRELARKLNELEQRYDGQFEVVFEAIRKLMAPPPVGKKRRIGFIIPNDRESN